MSILGAQRTNPALNGKLLPDERQGLLPVAQCAIELRFLNGMQDLLEDRPRAIAHTFQILAGHQTLWPDLLRRRLGNEAPHKIVRIQFPVARQAIQPMKLKVFLKARKPHETLQCRGTHLKNILEAQVVRDQRLDLCGVVI